MQPRRRSLPASLYPIRPLSNRGKLSADARASTDDLEGIWSAALHHPRRLQRAQGDEQHTHRDIARTMARFPAASEC